jgi:hypothetical protein
VAVVSLKLVQLSMKNSLKLQHVFLSLHNSFQIF